MIDTSLYFLFRLTVLILIRPLDEIWLVSFDQKNYFTPNSILTFYFPLTGMVFSDIREKSPPLLSYAFLRLHHFFSSFSDFTSLTSPLTPSVPHSMSSTLSSPKLIFTCSLITYSKTYKSLICTPNVLTFIFPITSTGSFWTNWELISQPLLLLLLSFLTSL